MAETILSIVNEGLKLFNTEEAKSLALRVAGYQEDFNAEMAKGENRDDAKLDMLDRELCELGGLFLTILKSATSPTKS